MKILPVENINRNKVTKRSINHATPAFADKKSSNDIYIYSTGIPRGYISFKSSDADDEFNFSPESEKLIKEAKNIALGLGHKEITSHHIIEAAIRETEKNIEKLGEETIASGAIESVSTLNTLANNYAKKSMVSSEGDFEYFKTSISQLREDNNKYLENLPLKEEGQEEVLDFSESMKRKLKALPKEMSQINPYSLLATAFNTLTDKAIAFPSEFLKDFTTISFFRNLDDISQKYIKTYDSKAIDVWNKLALGSNLNIIYQNKEEADRITASLMETIDMPKHGTFNSENTLIYSLSDEVEPEQLLEEIKSIASVLPDKEKFFVADIDSLTTTTPAENGILLTTLPEKIIDYANNNKDNVKFIFFNQEENYNEKMLNPDIKKMFTNFIPYSIPPMRTFETQELFNKDKKLLKDIKTPFTKQARNKAILYSDKIEGVFPEKSIDLMKRISNYYGESKKRITEKDVDEFAYIAKDIFNKIEDGTNIIYDTGKNLSSLYGKETIKKDLEAIVKQIKTGRAGTKGYLLYAQDEEAGSGKRFTAQALAGEAQVPFIEISSTDFAYNMYVDSRTKTPPKDLMKIVFDNAKKAAEQNKDKTAIIYINNFEELAFEGIYNIGYKQAVAQLEKEIAKAQSEDVNLIILGGTNKYYSDAIPMFVRDFNQTLSIDSPAFNKQSRREILLNRINTSKLPLAAKTNKDKEVLIDKLTQITEYMSFVDIKLLVDKAQNIMIERGKAKASLGEFIEAYLQITTGRTSRPQMPEYNKRITTSHECGHALNLEIMGNILKEKGQPWHQAEKVNFITLDPRGNFLGAVFEGKNENIDYPFEAMFTGLVCAFGGYAAEKLFYGIDGSCGISQDLAQASASAKNGVERFGFGFNTGKISNAAGIKSGEYHENVFKDMDIILKNAQLASDLITETYKDFNKWFTDKYSKLIGTDDCMVDGDTFRALLANWKQKQPPKIQEEFEILSDMVMDIIKSSKNGKIYGKLKTVKL